MIDLNAITKYWIDFYSSVNMNNLARSIDGKMKLKFSKKRSSLINRALEQGLSRVMLFPPIREQKKWLGHLKIVVELLLKPDRGQEISGVWFSPGTVEKYFPEGISFLNRPNGPYLSFINDDPGVPKETYNRKLEDIAISFNEVGQTGQTLFEYFVFWIYYFNELKKVEMPYLDTVHINCLLDSDLPDKKILVVKGDKNGKCLRIFAWPKTYNEYNAQGARPTVIIPLD